MNRNQRGRWVAGLLLGAWLLVVAWQVSEHRRVVDAARYDLRSRSREIANTVSAVIRAAEFRGTVVQDKLDPVLNLLVNGRTNAIVGPSDLISVELLNTNGEAVVSKGDTNLFPRDILARSESQGTELEFWSSNYVAFVLPVEGASNAASILPSPRSFNNGTNGLDRGGMDFSRRGPRLDDTNRDGFLAGGNPPPPLTNAAGEMLPPPPDDNRPPGGERGRGGNRRPPWLRWMSEADFKTLVATHELHGLVFAMSTDSYHATCTHDLWLRFVIVFFAGISALGGGLAWRNTAKTAELQIRLVRASEQNTHLKELNLAAAGLAHETRNPLNIIRGQAQMLARLPDASADVRAQSKTIVDQTDKVTAQLTEFINYSRPREVRRSKVALAAACGEVVRTLAFDLDEKKLRVEITGETLAIEADEQLLRQLLFNLLINAVQAADAPGKIQIQVQRSGSQSAVFEIRDEGPGVPPENRLEIFKPYFTTHQKGTGLGLAVVQQIVHAHGWDIVCLPNEPRGAIFCVSHLKVMA